MQEREIISVSQLNLYLKRLMDQDPLLASVLVRGELSNYKIYPSGHHYFTLKDEEGSLRCVMFRSAASKVRFRPENGMKALALGRVAVFPRDGQYQLYVNELTPDGLGDLHVAYEQLKAKLQAEGLFAQEHKKPLPQYPERIAIVTSSAGAAVRDILRILKARYPLAKVLLLPVRVQGKEAPAEIAGAIRYANRWRLADLIITGRGGGSLEDLWAFNEELVVRAIYDSEIPVISAVGHEPDVTLSDFAADLRAATPSNAAELAVPDRAELEARLNTLGQRLLHTEQKRLKEDRDQVTRLAESRAMQSPLNYLQDKRVLLDHVGGRLSLVERNCLSRQKERFGRLAASLDALSPLKVLGRGYSIVRREDGSVPKRALEVQPGEKLRVRLEEGTLSCTVDGAEG